MMNGIIYKINTSFQITQQKYLKIIEEFKKIQYLIKFFMMKE